MPPGEAVAGGMKAMVAGGLVMLSHADMGQVRSGDQQVVPVPSKMAAFKARHDRGRKAVWRRLFCLRIKIAEKVGRIERENRCCSSGEEQTGN